MKQQAQNIAHLLTRNILSTSSVVAIMGVAAFAAAPTGGYTPGSTLDPDCNPGGADCSVVFSESKFVDGTGVVGISVKSTTGFAKLDITSADTGQSHINFGGGTTPDKEKVRIDTNGNVGIGTNSPQATLDVKGTMIQGAGSVGTLTSGIVEYFTADRSATEYFHLKLPYDLTTDNKMYHIHVTGYAYGSGEIIDITYVGYVYKNGSLLKSTKHSVNSSTAITAHEYIGSDNKLYLHFQLPSTYYAGFRVDSMKVGNGTVLKKGDITVIKSSTAEL